MNDYKKTAEPSLNTYSHNSRFTESCLFLLIILIEAGIFIYLIYGKRIVGGHDGFQYFTIQYYFLNNVVNYGEIPQWAPFMTHGTLATMGYIGPTGIFQNILFLSGSLFKNVNFLTLFYIGIFLDEIMLLIGVWLLARRFFASPFTIFFITLSIMGSCIWILQPWWNFHIYYAIPLIIYLVHAFIDSGKWRYYFLAGNLLFMQCLGNLPYFLPVTTLVIFLYFLFYFIFNYHDTWHNIKTINFGWSFVLTTSIIIILFALLNAIMSIGMDQIVNYNALRNLDGSATLDGFLTYGGKLNWKAWWELILGISPFLDYTLYIGLLSVPFILLGLIFNLNKQNAHFFLTIIILMLFSMGTFVSIFFYYSWPMMKYFRHLMLVAPIIKVFLCFLAGFGIDAVFFNKSRWQNPAILRISLAVTSVFMFGLSLFLWILSNNYKTCAKLLKSMGSYTLPLFNTIFNEDILTSLLNRTTLFAIIASILLAVLFFINQKKYILPLIIFILPLHCADIYGFKLSEISFKTAQLNNEMYKITYFQSMPYAKRRDVSLNNNPREEILKILPIQEPGVLYSSTDVFLFKDELSNQFRNDFWLLPLDNYMRAYWGQSIHDLSVKPHALLFGFRMEFPKGHPAALKNSGVTEDKIQFFSEANFISSDDAIASEITNSNYKGDTIFLSYTANNNISPADSAKLLKDELASDKRLRLPYQVRRFDANNLEVTTNTNNLKSVWLLYSDVWHPLWKATVNGKETPVYKANLAYKAVKMETGLNKVHFYFKSKLISVLYFIFGLNALCWLVIIIYITGKIALYNPKNLYY